MFLQAIRDRVSSWFSWVLLFVIGIPFAFWGINSYFTGSENVDVATVNGEAISAQFFRQASLQEENRLRKQFGADFQGELLEDPTIKRSLLDRLINEQVNLQTAQGKRFRISPAQVAKIITMNESFQTEGSFDKDRYNNLLQMQSTTSHVFEKQLEQSLLSEQLKTGLAGSGFATELEVNFFGEIQFQRRDIRYAVIEKQRFLEQVEIHPGELASYYQENISQFQTPELVQIQYLSLQLEDMAGDIQVSQSDLAALYAERVNELGKPERRKISHILINLSSDATDEKEKEALQKLILMKEDLAQEKNFSLLAKEFSEDIGSAPNGGDLGYYTMEGTLDPAVESAAFSLELNQVSEPVRSKYGYHLIKVTEIDKEEAPAFEELQEELSLEIRKQRVTDAFYEKAERLQELVFEHPDNLQMASEQLGLKIQTTEPFSRTGGSGIAALQDFIAQAFSPPVLYQGENSEVFELPGEILVALRLENHIPAQAKPQEEVEEEILERVKESKSIAMAKSLGEKLSKELAAGGDFDQLTNEYAIDWQTRKQVSRQGGENLPPYVIAEVFKLQKPEEGQPVYGAKALSTGDYLLYAVDRVGQSDEGWGDTEKQLMRRDIAKLRGANSYIHYLATIRANADIKVFEQNL